MHVCADPPSRQVTYGVAQTHHSLTHESCLLCRCMHFKEGRRNEPTTDEIGADANEFLKVGQRQPHHVAYRYGFNDK